MRRRSRESVAATTLWLVALVFAASWIDTWVTLPATLAWMTYVLAFLGTVILWNLDRIREVWRADPADEHR